MADDDQVPGGPSLGSSASPSLSADWRPAPDTFAGAAAVVVEFQLTEDEVVPGLRSQLLRNRRLRLLFAIGVLLTFLGVVSAVVIDTFFGVVFGLIGVFYVALTATVVVVGPRRAWRRNPVLRGQQFIAFSPDGIYARSTVAESRLQWRVYAGMIETERCYMMRLANRKAYVFVPKRAFRSSGDETAFRNMARLHLKVDAGPEALR
jgi:hypothetical protein